MDNNARQRDIERHLAPVLKRYADRENIVIPKADPQQTIDQYLSKIMDVSEIAGKSILEFGAGGSQYLPIFLDHGCSTYYANDLIVERLAASRVDDPRYHEIPGDFLAIELPEKVDMVFASLTMMMLTHLHDLLIAKIRETLKPGGIFVSRDANYLCPLSFWRVIKNNALDSTPAFNPLSYAGKFRKAGFEVERLVPMTGPVPGVTGNWLLGTSFWIRARKL